jgi:transcriptional regulator with XRE-family HTH domain
MNDQRRFPNLQLKRERESRGWSQGDLAEKIGTTQKIVSRWERGENGPVPYYRQKLIKLFDKNATELGLIEEQEQLTSSHTRLSLSTTAKQPPDDVASEKSDFPPLDKESYDNGVYSPESTPLSSLQQRGEPLAVQGVPVVLIPTQQAIDLLRNTSDTTPEQQLGALLALEANELAIFFDEGWSVEELLATLRVVLPGAYVMSKITRRAFGRKLVQFGAAAFVSRIPIPTGRHISEEARVKLHHALGESIAAGWKLFHTAGIAQVLAVGQAQLVLVQQNHSLLYPSVQPLYYSGVYRLMGAALFFQEKYEEAIRAQNSAYAAALEIADTWNMAQCRTWQAYCYQSQGQHDRAIQAIESALQLCTEQNDEASRRLRSHLLACWAENATLVHEHRVTQEKLEASLALLEGIGPNEEFDRSHWLQIAGNCALRVKNYPIAIQHFEEALSELAPNWIMRYTVTAMPLAVAYAHMRERDKSLAVAKKAVSLIGAFNAPVINSQLAEYIQHDLPELFPGDSVVNTFVTDVRRQLPQISALVG